MSEFEVFPEKPAPPPPPPPPPHEDLFTRIASLWIWSVFFFVTSGLSYSFLSSLSSMLTPLLSSGMMYPGGYGRGGPMSGSMMAETFTFVIPVIHVAGMIANVGSWAFLYLYFTVYLPPALILREPNGLDDRRRRIAASALRRTYLLTIAAAIARMLPELILFLMPALSRFS